jgi:inorganic pyrophosphatase
MRSWFLLALVPAVLTAAQPIEISHELPASAVMQLAKSLAASNAVARHLWRDTPPLNTDGTVNGYIEISRGDRRKWEFDMAANERAIDRMIPIEIGGYPVNYGFVPQTVSYDGDPFDVLVLGPPIAGGQTVHGAIVGLLLMDDEKGSDGKVVISTITNGRPDYALTERDRRTIADYFRRYKLLEPDKFSTVSGWGSVEDGLALVQLTHAFFEDCRRVPITTCRVARATLTRVTHDSAALPAGTRPTTASWRSLRRPVRGCRVRLQVSTGP